MVRVYLGRMTFLDPQIDGEHKAIIHSIDKVILCDTEETASEVGERMLDVCESYFIPSLYRGEVEYECDVPQINPRSRGYIGDPSVGKHIIFAMNTGLGEIHGNHELRDYKTYDPEKGIQMPSVEELMERFSRDVMDWSLPLPYLSTNRESLEDVELFALKSPTNPYERNKNFRRGKKK